MADFGTNPRKLVRRDDPDTSHQAAHSIDSTKLEKMVYEAIARFGSEGCISDQVRALFSFLPYSSVTARYKALVEKKLIEFIGVRKGQSGRNQRIMRVMNNGVLFQ